MLVKTLERCLKHTIILRKLAIPVTSIDIFLMICWCSSLANFCFSTCIGGKMNNVHAVTQTHIVIFVNHTGASLTSRRIERSLEIWSKACFDSASFCDALRTSSADSRIQRHLWLIDESESSNRDSEYLERNSWIRMQRNYKESRVFMTGRTQHGRLCVQ